MTATTCHSPGWAVLGFSPSTVTFRRAVVLVFMFMGVYTIIALTGVTRIFKYHQLITYSQPLLSSPRSLFQNWNAKDDETASDELSDFHMYNISKSSAAKTWPRPQLHVLIDARHHLEEPINLCRTLLSVVIQGYPPPILVGYRSEIDTEKKEDDKGGENKMASLTGSFLGQALDAMQYTKFQAIEEKGAKTERPENIVVFLGRDQWVQMPAEVTVRRYLQHKEVLSKRLARQYEVLTGRHKDGDPETSTRTDKREGYRLGVLFPASRRKTCFEWDEVCNERYRSNSAKDYDADISTEKDGFPLDFEHRDDILPESSLPVDIHGTFPDPKDQDSAQKHGIPARYQRPRHLSGGAFIGSAGHVELLLKGALERVGWLQHDNGKDGNQVPKSLEKDEEADPLTYLFSEMFFEQEIERTLGKYQADRDLDAPISPGKKDTTKKKRRWSWWWSTEASFLDWLSTATGGKTDQTTTNTPESDPPGKHHPDDSNSSSSTTSSQNYEFGIALDYENRIFQDMAEYIQQDKANSSLRLRINMTRDIHFFSYSVPNLVRSPSQSASHLFDKPLMLPPEMLHPLSPDGKSSPLGLNSAIYNKFLNKILEAAAKVKVALSAEETDQQKLREGGRRRKKIKRSRPEQEEDTDINTEGEEEVEEEEEEEPRIQEIKTTLKITWSSLEWVTNVFVPRGSIPSVLDMSLFAAAAVAVEEEEEDGEQEQGSQNDAPASNILLDSYWHKLWFNQQRKQSHHPMPHQTQQQKQEGNKQGTTTNKWREEDVIPAKYALLDEYRAPNPFIYALEANAWGGEHNNWWNLRGGRGGFWTDQGQ
ncbi:hypothetical protein V8F33_003611 [Rhypophila sp. PSN 637]